MIMERLLKNRNRTRLVRNLGFLGLLLLSLSALAPAFTSRAQDGARKQVLILHSYHTGYKWTDDVNRGILDYLANEVEDIEIQIEYMDTKRIFDEQYLQYLYETYKYKFQHRQFDVIISSDDNAFDFLLDHRDELFPNTPVVFSGVNFFDPARLVGHDNFTGVNEAADIRSGLDLAFDLHPDAKRVIVINDSTTTGIKVHEEIMKVVPNYESRARFVLIEYSDMQNIQTVVHSLSPGDFVFYTLFFRDKNGQFYEYDESILSIVESSSVPVYGTWDFSLGFGIVGGMLTSGYYQGETAAKLAQRILAGEDADNIPVVMESPNRYMFDYEVLQAWDIPLSSLPPDSIFINNPPTFYERYKWGIWGGSIVLAALVLIILILTSANIRRRRAEAALRVSNRELQAMRDSLEERVLERTMTLNQRSSQLEAAAQVAREAAAIRDLRLLLDEIVHLISERMGFYHTAIFLLDEAAEYVVLRAASSEGGQGMLEQGYQLPVDERSIIGYVASMGRPHIVLDANKNAISADNPELPLTRSEIALPLTIQERVVGVLDVQSTAPQAFTDADLTILQTLADQVSLAIENARLLQETQDQLREIRSLAGERERGGWVQLTTERPGWGYVYDGIDVVARDTLPTLQTAPGLSVPLRVRQETIGHLTLALDDRTPTPQEIELAQAVADRVSQALERARLFQETQRRAARDRMLSQMTARFAQTINMDALLQAAVRELGQLPNVTEVSVHVASPETSPPADKDRENPDEAQVELQSSLRTDADEGEIEPE
jgi:GAF domain-containing protein/ABC-type uncharacterized transport system substrate-binding protein